MTGETIHLEGVTKTFVAGQPPSVPSLDLTADAGKVTVLIGPSGCGKTTTLRMINRLIDPTAGKITIGNNDICDRPLTELRRSIGYVIQQVGLFPHKTVAQNIATVCDLLGWDKSKQDARVDELAELMGIDQNFLGRYPAELSGDQQQRVGVARALAADPAVLLMDEPTSALDPISTSKIEELTLELKKDYTIVIVTHNMQQAMRISDKTAFFLLGDLIEYSDTETLFSTPKEKKTEDYITGRFG